MVFVFAGKLSCVMVIWSLCSTLHWCTDYFHWHHIWLSPSVRSHGLCLIRHPAIILSWVLSSSLKTFHKFIPGDDSRGADERWCSARGCVTISRALQIKHQTRNRGIWNHLSQPISNIHFSNLISVSTIQIWAH